MAKTVFGMPSIGKKSQAEDSPNAGVQTGSQGSQMQRNGQTGNRPAAKPATAKPATAKPATAKPATAKPAMAKPAMAKPVSTPMAKPTSPTQGGGAAPGAPGGAARTVFGMPAVKLPGGNGPAQTPAAPPSQAGMPFQATQVQQPQQQRENPPRKAASPAPSPEEGRESTTTGMAAQKRAEASSVGDDSGAGTVFEPPDAGPTGLDDILSDVPGTDDAPVSDAGPDDVSSEAPEPVSSSAPPKARKGGFTGRKVAFLLLILAAIGIIVAFWMMSRDSAAPVAAPPASAPLGTPNAVPPPPPPPGAESEPRGSASQSVCGQRV